jgi:flagellar protein FlaG
MEIRSIAVLQHGQPGRGQSLLKAEQLGRQRQQLAVSGPLESGGERKDENQVAKEEILSKIKEISEEGVYSVRFEKDDKINELIVKVVDQKTDEVIRQLPPEEILGLRQYLTELRGNLTNSVK